MGLGLFVAGGFGVWIGWALPRTRVALWGAAAGLLVLLAEVLGLVAIGAAIVLAFLDLAEDSTVFEIIVELGRLIFVDVSLVATVLAAIILLAYGGAGALGAIVGRSMRKPRGGNAA